MTLFSLFIGDAVNIAILLLVLILMALIGLILIAFGGNQK